LTPEPTLISIITPTLNEETTLPARAGELSEQDKPWEWIVADGGSSDATVTVAEESGATVVAAPRGRGPQQNAGAALAGGDVLLFLHADTRLPPGALTAIRSALTDPTLIGGNFRLRFEGDDLTSRFFTGFYRLQRRWLRAYYGDSAIWLRRELFEQLGGFPDYPIMEDFELVRRLEQAGKTTCLSPIVETSARRYRGRVVSSLARWAAIYGLYRMGVSAHTLARLYPSRR
jgi:rSAM/selenodomain-associated transferase 2